ncbi:hypothetical protein PUNSTDRAFT_137162 [Punctularia strigosozonata HHB-11173 SS5]|uniref:uncharacterized protein n=1 Tax=Punctularia strigosozonata (strain HHB-11173) TaxID=741275 RepID=UPI0004417CEC|nr:uncharacterized protein PUNSTDRAFT_137162 [Punctularia strigosozonata HHB-11173 SS5]EIN05668.1 hypothetical protein PUNSTDRAFT_137162 [Punctularia strigosozonata HHB-11173 SS5]
MLKAFKEVVEVLPISRYPVTQRWQRPRLVIGILAVLSTVVYAALTTWNVLTQGREPVYTTTLRTTMPSKDSNLKCQVRNIEVGDLVYASPDGGFAWSVTGIDTGFDVGAIDGGINYAGAKMVANVINMNIFYYWSIQSFKYGVCANATIPQLSGSDTDSQEVAKGPDGREITSVITMCSNFDLDMSNPGTWAPPAQTAIQNAFYDLAVYFQTLNFSNNTFPICYFPPYCDPDTHLPPPSNTAVTPTNSYDLTAWMAGISYSPLTIESNYTTTGGIVMGEQHMVTVAADNTTTSFLDAFERTYTNGSGPSGMNIGLTGIGALHLMTQAQNLANNFVEPPAITTIRSAALGVLNVLADAAIKDLNDRVIGSSYICTATSSTWRSAPSMLAMILGNNASLFGVWLVISVAVASRWEQHHVRNRSAKEEDCPEPVTPVSPIGLRNKYSETPQKSLEKDAEAALALPVLNLAPGPDSPISPESPSSNIAYPEGLSQHLQVRREASDDTIQS